MAKIATSDFLGTPAQTPDSLDDVSGDRRRNEDSDAEECAGHQQHDKGQNTLQPTRGLSEGR